MYAYQVLILWLPLLSLAKGDPREFSEYVLDCDPRVDSHCDGLMLHQIAGNLTESESDVFIKINTSQMEIVKFDSLESVRISGINTTISCTSEESGLLFSNISRLTIDSVT